MDLQLLERLRFFEQKLEKQERALERIYAKLDSVEKGMLTEGRFVWFLFKFWLAYVAVRVFVSQKITILGYAAAALSLVKEHWADVLEKVGMVILIPMILLIGYIAIDAIFRKIERKKNR